VSSVRIKVTSGSIEANPDFHVWQSQTRPHDEIVPSQPHIVGDDAQIDQEVIGWIHQLPSPLRTHLHRKTRKLLPFSISYLVYAQ
jgi:hypothetical protein